MNSALDVTCERPLLDVTETTNDYPYSVSTYDYGIIKFIKSIDKFRAAPQEQDIETIYQTLNSLSAKVDDLFNEVSSKGHVEIPSGLHSTLDKAVESQSTVPPPADLESWARKISDEHFND
jgi:hypothetical protein